MGLNHNREDFALIKEILQNVSEITNTNAICAGGAPRDITMDLIIRDYDIYVTVPNTVGNTLDNFILPAIQQKFIDMFGNEVSDPKLIGETWYEDNYIHSIYEFNILEMIDIQIIFTKTEWELETIVKDFPMSLSQAWITKNSNKVETTPMFDRSIELRTGVYSHKCKSSYLAKIIQKFRGFAIIPVNHMFCQAQFAKSIRQSMEIPY